MALLSTLAEIGSGQSEEKLHSDRVNDSSCGTPSPLLWRWERGSCFVGNREIYLAIPNPRPEDRPIELELNVPEPLDLSDLLGSLEDIPPLEKIDEKSSPYAGTLPLASAAPLEFSSTEPIVISGSPGRVQPAEALVLPENPLRTPSKPKSESPPKADAAPKPADDKAAAPVTPDKPAPSSTTNESPSSNERPIRIGGAPSDSRTTEPARVPSLETDPTEDQPTENASVPPSASEDVKVKEKPGTDSAPKLIQISPEKAQPLNSTSESTSEPKGATENTNEKSTRPKMRTITLNSDPTRDQEVPSPAELKSTPLKSSTADDDKKAFGGTKPQAAPKTFVSRPSQANISDLKRESSLSAAGTDRMQRVDKCLAYYLTHLETTVERSPWSVMHAMLPFGVEGEILVGNQRVNAIQWLCYNGTCRGQKLFTPTTRFFKPNVGGGVQGHEGQFLAMLAQSQVAAEYPLMIGGKRFSIEDLVKYEMATCRERSELTFKLIGLSYYVDTSQVWTTDRRSRWNIEKLVKEELAQPINGAACGGVHRLMGLTFALKQRRAESRPIDGHFARADKFIHDFIDYTWKLQNGDGSFSTSWFEGRANEPNMERKVQTTGHILEWLAFTLPEEELQSARFQMSVDFLLSQIWDKRDHKWPIGPRGHATRALALYQQRVQGVQPGQRREVLADQIQSLRISR